MWRKKIWSIILSVLGSSPAFADTLTIPYDFTAGTTIQSSQMNSNFTEVENIVNGNLTNANIKSSAAIALSKINLTDEGMWLRAAGNRGVSFGVTGDTVPRVSLYTTSTGLGSISFGAGSASAQDLLLKRVDANTLAVRNFADSADKNLTLGDLTASGAVAITGNVTLGSVTSGTWAGTAIGATKGGTGLTSATAGDTLYASAADTWARLPKGTALQFYRMNAGATAPEWAAAPNSFTLYTKSADFTANDGAHSYYRITATCTVTLPASPADGSVRKFKVTSGTATFAFNGAETINHAHGVSDQTLTLTAEDGVIELTAVSGGWDET